MAQWNEMMEDPEQKIGRPRQLFTGPPQRGYIADGLSAEPRVSAIGYLGVELGLGGQGAVHQGLAAELPDAHLVAWTTTSIRS